MNSHGRVGKNTAQKMSIHHCTNFLTKWQGCVRIFSRFSHWWPFFLLWRRPCCLHHVCAAKFICRIWITSLVPPAPSNFPSFPTKSHQSIWIRILLGNDYSKKWSPSKHFSSGACLPYVDLLHEHACNKLHAICDPYLTREWVKQLLVCQELHNIWDLGPKNGLRSNLLASEFFSGELHSYPPRDTVCRLWPHHLLLWPITLANDIHCAMNL